MLSSEEIDEVADFWIGGTIQGPVIQLVIIGCCLGRVIGSVTISHAPRASLECPHWAESGLSLRRIEGLMRRLKPGLDDLAHISLQMFDQTAWWQGIVPRWPSGVTFIGSQRVTSGNKPGSLVWTSRRSGKKLKVQLVSELFARLFVVQDNDLEVGRGIGDTFPE